MKNETKSILGIACLYTIVSALFSLLGRLVTVFSEESPQAGLKYFLNGSMLWLVAAAITVYVLYSLNARQKQGFAAMLDNVIIRKTSGVLIAITGLFALATSFPPFVNSIVSFKTLEAMSISTDALMRATIAEAVGLLIDICQILFGIYLLKYNNKTDGKIA